MDGYNFMPKVLVIDDEAGPRASLRILLKPRYEVLCAVTAERGLSLLKEHRPSVVVLDIRMPGMSGIEGLREIRKIDKAVCVIMLTGYGMLQTAREAMRLGANDYIKKPFDTSEMLEVIEAGHRAAEENRRGKRASSELVESNRKLTEELARQEKLAHVGQVSREFAHDLRNPLTVAGCYVELLSCKLTESRDRLGPDYGDTSQFVEAIQKGIRQCYELADMWQHYGTNEPDLQSPVCIRDVADEIISGMAPMSGGRDTRLHCDVHPDETIVRGNRMLLLRAVQNVIYNALQAVNPISGRVDVDISRRGASVVVVVKDNGAGIDQRLLSRIFEHNFTTKSSSGGTGLGLPITKKVVEAHGGTVAIASDVNEGTTVTIALTSMVVANEGEVEDDRMASAS